MSVELDSHNNIRVGDTVHVTQLFGVDPDNEDHRQVLETRKGVVVKITEKPEDHFFGTVYDVKYPNGRAHGASIRQLRPDGCLMVMDDELLGRV
jgi:hypothetical protein